MASMETRQSIDELLYNLNTLERYVRIGRYREAEILTAYIESEYLTGRNAYRSNH